MRPAGQQTSSSLQSVGWPIALIGWILYGVGLATHGHQIEIIGWVIQGVGYVLATIGRIQQFRETKSTTYNLEEAKER